MKRLFIFWVILLPALTQHVHAQYYSVNYDARTVAAMAAAFGTEAVAESYYREQVDDILKHYTATSCRQNNGTNVRPETSCSSATPPAKSRTWLST